MAALSQEGIQRLAQRASQGAGSQDYKSVTKTLRQEMWEHVGVVRHATALQRALQTIRTLTAQARACASARPATLVKCLELDNLCRTAEAIAMAALTRQESRGTHYREDFPDKNDTDWHCNVVVRQEADGTLQAHKVPVIAV